MKQRKHVLPIALFCILFLAYVLYFVRVVQNPATTDIYGEKTRQSQILSEVLPKTELSQPTKTETKEKSKIQEFFSKIKPFSDDEKDQVKQDRIKYVNFDYLNVRQQPISTSNLVGKLNRNDKVAIIEYPNTNWAHIEVVESSSLPFGSSGYVARRYLVAEKVVTPFSQVVEIPNLVYYHITDEQGKYPSDQTLPVNNFVVQVDYMVEQQVETITFADLQSIKSGDKAIPQNAVILTFDGGYNDHYAAFKYLTTKNLKGVFFIPTNVIGSEGYLTWHEVREMKEEGMEIGSLGQNIIYYGNASDELLKNEILGSKQTLEQQLKQTTTVFAYPKGSYLKRAEPFLTEAGYQFARTTIPATQFDLAVPYKIPGLRVYPTAAVNQLKAWGIGL